MGKAKAKYLWLFGENEGQTHNNNSFYFWDHICCLDDDIDKYLVLERTNKNKEFFARLPKDKKNKIVWSNTGE